MDNCIHPSAVLFSSDTLESSWLTLVVAGRNRCHLTLPYVHSKQACHELSKIFYLYSCGNSHELKVMLKHALYLVQNSGLEHVL